MPKGISTLVEIDSQPQIWESILKEYQETSMQIPDSIRGNSKNIIVTGCGSTYYLSISMAALLRKHGFRAWALPAAELVFFPEALPSGESTLIAISRSGTTTETLRAVDQFRGAMNHGPVVAITTRPDSILAREADFTIAAPQAQEKSVAQTRSFTSMFILSQILSGALVNDNHVAIRLNVLPHVVEVLNERTSCFAKEIGEDSSINRVFFLGGGPLYGLACEAMLKTKEMACFWAEAYFPLEFRHGPKAVADENTLIVCFASDSQRKAEAMVLQEMRHLGAKALVLTENSNTPDWIGIDYVVPLNSGLDEWDRGAIYLPLIHRIAYYRALFKGLDPDHPKNLSVVVELNQMGE